MASAYSDNKDWGNAVKHYNLCLKYDGEYLQALINIGQLEIKRDNLSSSLSNFERALVIQAHNLEAKEGLAKVQELIRKRNVD